MIYNLDELILNLEIPQLSDWPGSVGGAEDNV